MNTEFEGVPGIAAPARRALAAAGVRAVGDLARFTEAEVAAWHGIGPRVMVSLQDLMAAQAVRFRTETEEKGREDG